MAKNQSFDIESKVEAQELDNALNQARKELSTRYDFKGIAFEIDWNRKENVITLHAPDEHKLRAVWDVLQNKLIGRKLPLKNFEPQDVDSAALGTLKQRVTIQQGIPSDKGKAIAKFIKDKKLKKVQAQIQGDTVRILSPSRDELQNVMQLLKSEDFGVELQFGNFRSA
ncbi:MAG: YajQ family cyclic di-GMP-binding protein [Myxococcota bacterium]